MLVTSRFTPTAPILDERFSLSERLLWASGVRATARRFWRMISPLEGASLRARWLAYRHRATRVVSMLFGRPGSGDDTR